MSLVEVGSWAPEPGTLAGLWCLLPPNWGQHQSSGVFSESPFPQPESYPQVWVRGDGEWGGADKLLNEVVLIPGRWHGTMLLIMLVVSSQLAAVWCPGCPDGELWTGRNFLWGCYLLGANQCCSLDFTWYDIFLWSEYVFIPL